MNIQEYNNIKDYTYDEYCAYLINKYGPATGPYFLDTYWTKTKKPQQPTTNKKVTRTKEGLFLHHLQENHVASLSTPSVAATHPYELQSAENLVPCDYLEHLLLHIMICEDPQPFEGEYVGANGTLTWILPALVGFFEKRHIAQEWQLPAFDRIANNKDVYDTLIDRFIHSERIQENCDVTEEELRNLVSDRINFEHNDIVLEQLEDYLTIDNKVLVDLGTGLGKTTTALQYAFNHLYNCLILCPSHIILDGWQKNNLQYTKLTGKPLTIMSYQTFANSYKTIDFSQYDLIICDEAHHCRGPVWGVGVKYVIDNKLCKVIGLTATPADVGDLFGGNIAKGYSVCEGIEKGIIHPISYVGAFYDTSIIKEQVAAFEDQELIGQLDLVLNNTPELKDIIIRNMPASKRKCIIFTQSIEAMDEAINIMKNIYPNAEYRKIHSHQSDDENQKNKDWFEHAEEGFLCAVNMISEGAHYKGVNTIFMFRKTKSELLFQQQLGRIITLVKYENPHSILFDLVNNANSLEPARQLRLTIGKIKQKLEQEKNFNLSGQIIWKDYCADIISILEQINFLSIYNRKQVYQFDVQTGKILQKYNSITEASLQTKISISKISMVVNKKRQTAGGFYWSFSKEDSVPQDVNDYIGMGYMKTVYQYDSQGNFLQSWISATEAEQSLGIAKGKVSAACLGNQQTAGCYKWSYIYTDTFQSVQKENVIKNKVGHNEKCKTYQYDMQTGAFIQEFESLSAAGAIYGNRTNIARACSGLQHSAYNFYWSFIRKNNYKEIKPEAFNKKKCGIKKKVYQYDMTTKAFIKEYDTAADACRANGLYKGAVGAACTGAQNSAGGFYWSHFKADNYDDICLDNSK